MASANELARPLGHEPAAVADPDRIARKLENEVTQRIFAIGLTLQGAAAVAVDPLVRRRIEEAITDTETVVQIIRDTVFGCDHRQDDWGHAEAVQRSQS